MEFVNTPGLNRPLAPQAVVLLNPATGAAYAAGTSTVADSTGIAFAPADCAHTYGYNSLQQLVTDTATDGVSTWVKTYTYTAGKLTGETKWVKA